jgi:hypothetical protein
MLASAFVIVGAVFAVEARRRLDADQFADKFSLASSIIGQLL